jgi:hypothetical protein
MFGPLPRLHRLLVIAIALAVGVISGLLLVTVVESTTAGIVAGVGWGLLAGLLLEYLALHDFRHRARPVRVRRD